MTETERMYAYFICSIPMIGGVRAGQLLSRFGTRRESMKPVPPAGGRY